MYLRKRVITFSLILFTMISSTSEAHSHAADGGLMAVLHNTGHFVEKFLSTISVAWIAVLLFSAGLLYTLRRLFLHKSGV